MNNAPLMLLHDPFPIQIERAQGHYVYDKEGKAYLDLFSGLGVHVLGHRHPLVLEAIAQQLDRYLHLSNTFISEPTLQLAQCLTELTFPSRVFFTNSGTEANEAAFKLARKWGKSHRKHRFLILDRSFHGRTMGSLSLTAQPILHKGFEPLLTDIGTFEMNDLDDLRQKIDNTTCAVFVELVQGSGGIRPVERAWLAELLKLKEKYNFLVIVDEVQTGLGRTGKLFAYQHFNFLPDVMTLAKALGGGLPLGAVVIHERLKDVFQKGDHGTTFGGNPVSTNAGLAVLRKVSNPDFLYAVRTKGRWLRLHLERLRFEFPSLIQAVRGMGLMIGVELKTSARMIQQLALQEGILLNVIGDQIIRLLPPLTITCDEIRRFIQRLRKIFERVERMDKGVAP